ncbi:PepSY domain-containing protein [Bacillus sp. BRMEA1]|uniref:PepSY domain-containing protein n=1 Tax=Neobacillus endophyticus TaxID=2738405 RepID=UPI001563EE0F|nr:PepSY domain-containing protein [Neobacillus endophyticus]NRD79212.1 PepSY domain-containing protein [Neobacillus endophyticus]
MKKLIITLVFLFSFGCGAIYSAGYAHAESGYNTVNHPISAKKAKEIALKKVNGEFISIKLENDDGGEHYEVKIKKSGTIYEVEVDAKSGKVLEVEKEGTQDDDGHHGDDRHDDDDHLDD